VVNSNPSIDVTNCSIPTSVNLRASDITFECVNWDGNATYGMRCDNGTGCHNIKIKKTTYDGAAGLSDTFLSLTSSYWTGGPGSLLLENSVVQNMSIGVYVGVNFDADDEVIENVDGVDYSVVLRRNLIHDISYVSPDHNELFRMSEGSRDVLAEYNTFNCENGDTCNTGPIFFAPSGSTGGGNYRLRYNKIMGDDTGIQINNNDATALVNCVGPIYFDYNEVTGGVGTTKIAHSASGKADCANASANEYPPIDSCTGTTWNGSSWDCQ
jgi:hypothetical protein